MTSGSVLCNCVTNSDMCKAVNSQMYDSNDRMLYGKNRMWVLGNSRDKNGIYSRNLVHVIWRHWRSQSVVPSHYISSFTYHPLHSEMGFDKLIW